MSKLDVIDGHASFSQMVFIHTLKFSVRIELFVAPWLLTKCQICGGRACRHWWHFFKEWRWIELFPVSTKVTPGMKNYQCRHTSVYSARFKKHPSFAAEAGLLLHWKSQRTEISYSIGSNKQIPHDLCSTKKLDVQNCYTLHPRAQNIWWQRARGTRTNLERNAENLLHRPMKFEHAQQSIQMFWTLQRPTQ